MIDRRRFLTLASAGSALLLTPRIVFAAAETDRRFIFIIQRGAADGLHIVQPTGDPDFARLRGQFAEAPAGAARPPIKLDGVFGLHGALAETAKMFLAGEVLAFHAVASPYRDRSHFDGQNVIETGGSAPYQVRDGWLNRLATLLPKGRTPPIAFTPAMPMALRGPAEVTSYTVSKLANPSDDLLSRVDWLYQNDPVLHPLWASARETHGMAVGGADGPGQDPAAIGKLAASFLGREDGPRIAMIETLGWDTHNQQAPRLARVLAGLDALLANLKAGLGSTWSNTTVLIATEFGRTVAINGTGGTDHGTASAAMLLGGAVKGGRVIADWPGLAEARRFEGRDLAPTLALDALIAGAVAESFAIDPQQAARVLFPMAEAKVVPIGGLLRT